LQWSGIPWAAERLSSKRPIVLTDLDDLPEEAAAERALLMSNGVRSLLVVPVVAGEHVLGGLGFVATSAKRDWSTPVIDQSRLIADVLASALARKQAEDALRHSEATKAAVLASLTSYVAVLDRGGRITTVNESWARTSLDSTSSADDGLGGVGSDYLELWRGLAAGGLGEARAAIAGITGVLDGSRKGLVLEYSCLAHPGRWYVMAVVPLQATEGGAVVSLTDVTERKRAELEAQKSRQELAHFLRVSTIGELTASLAHELNQPLAAILANAQAAGHLVRDSPATPESTELLEILDDIASEDRRAGEVIRRLRELLRKGDPELALLDVNALVHEVVDLLASDALLRGVSVRLDVDPGRLAVRGDRVQLQQVLLNLTINAMEAMTGDGGNDRAVLVRTAAGETSVRISVADSGPGLGIATRGEVFEPFYTTKPNGLGMGLSIARSIVVAHGGTVEAKDNPTRGAIFTVVLPAASI
jgi:signal transduction histidine kinase